jgi:hypothetical protein
MPTEKSISKYSQTILMVSSGFETTFFLVDEGVPVTLWVVFVHAIQANSVAYHWHEAMTIQELSSH